MRPQGVVALQTLFFALTLSCSSAGERFDFTAIAGRWSDVQVNYPVQNVSRSVQLRIYFPKISPKAHSPRVLIALHDYNRTNREWSDYTDIKSYADQYGFVIVCPNMGQTSYETKFYAETVRPWDGVPGGKWVGEVLVPFLQKRFRLARDRETTGILGVSNGARGSILIACSYPNIFGAAAGISGYYDKSVLADKRIITSVYGKYAVFKSRWESDDNIINLASRLKNTRVFLAHAARDRDIPIEQSQLLGIRLRQLQKKSPDRYKFEYQESESYHPQEWRHSRSVVGDMMRFFDKNLEK